MAVSKTCMYLTIRQKPAIIYFIPTVRLVIEHRINETFYTLCAKLWILHIGIQFRRAW